MAWGDDWDLTGYNTPAADSGSGGSSGDYSGYVDPYTHPDYAPSSEGLSHYSDYALKPTGSSWDDWQKKLAGVLGGIKAPPTQKPPDPIKPANVQAALGQAGGGASALAALVNLKRQQAAWFLQNTNPMQMGLLGRSAGG